MQQYDVSLANPILRQREQIVDEMDEVDSTKILMLQGCICRCNTPWIIPHTFLAWARLYALAGHG